MTIAPAVSTLVAWSLILTTSSMAPAHTIPMAQSRSIPRATSAPSTPDKATTHQLFLTCETARSPCSRLATRLQHRKTRCPRASSARCILRRHVSVFHKIVRAPQRCSQVAQVAHKEDRLSRHCRARSSTLSTHHQELDTKAQQPCSRVLAPISNRTRRSNRTCHG